MATRRIKMLISNTYTQTLKTCFRKKLVLVSGAGYNSIVTKLTHRSCEKTDYQVKAWAKFDASSFDGLQFFAGLLKGKSFRTAASCTFKLFSVSIDDNWTETLIATIPGTPLSDGRWKGSITQSLLNPIDTTGEISFKIQVDLTRLGKEYSEVYFFNHLGIYGSFIRLSQEVDFLSITKKDL